MLATTHAPSLDAIRAGLEARLADLERRLERPDAPDSRAGGSGANDDADFAVAHIQYEDAVALHSRRLVEQRDLRIALARVDEGAYQTCVYCDGAIDPRRLRVLPTITSCIDCAREMERRAAMGLEN